MVCELADSAAEALWPSLLELQDFLRTDAALGAEQVGFVEAGGTWQLLTEPASIERASASKDACLFVPLRPSEESRPAPRSNGTDGRFSSSHTSKSVFSNLAFHAGERLLRDGTPRLGSHARSVFRLYLPMLLGGFRARQRGELFVSAHVAQSLDGRIACLNGHSQWISNEANLFHAHRMRALHDGVMVGRGTVESDDPALTVRHVGGRDPRRIVLNSSASLVGEDSSRYQVLRDSGCLLMTSEQSLTAGADSSSYAAEVEVVAVATGGAERLGPAQLIEPLLARGLHSIFLEGGSQTLSSFFEAGAIDLLHVHIAPMILGSGISSFSLPEVESVQQGRRMATEHFLLDGELLIECRPEVAARSSQASEQAGSC